MKKYSIVFLLFIICLALASCSDENDGNVDVSVTGYCSDENDGKVDVSVTGYFLENPGQSLPNGFLAELGISENKELFEYIESKDYTETTSYNKYGNDEITIEGQIYLKDPDRTFTFLGTEYDLWYINTVCEKNDTKALEYEIYKDIHGNAYHFLSKNGELIYYKNNDWPSGYRSQHDTQKKRAVECLELILGEEADEYVFRDWKLSARNYFFFNKNIDGVFTVESVTVSLGLDGTLEIFSQNWCGKYEKTCGEIGKEKIDTYLNFISDFEKEFSELFSDGFSDPLLFRYMNTDYLYVTAEHKLGTVYYFFEIE